MEHLTLLWINTRTTHKGDKSHEKSWQNKPCRKMIMIPESQYYKMLESFEKVVDELEEMRKILKNGDDKKNEMLCY